MTASDIYLEDENGQEEDPKCNIPRSKDAKTPSRKKDSHDEGEDDASASRKRDGGRRLKVAQDQRDRNRSGSAPPKRVVSDAHWRTNRSPPSSTKTKSNARVMSEAQQRADDGIRVKSLPVHSPDERRKKQDGRAASKSQGIGGDDGIRVFPTPPGSRRHSETVRTEQHDEAEYRGQKNREREGFRSGSPISREAGSGKRSKKPTPEKSPSPGSSAAREAARRRKSTRRIERSSDADHLPAHSDFPKEIESVKSPKGNVLSQVLGDSKKIFSKQQPIPLSAPRVPTIEAWLQETPDPFIDKKGPAEDILPALKANSQSKLSTEKVQPDNPNKIWDSIGPREVTMNVVQGSRRRKRIRSSAILEDNPFPAGYQSEDALNGSPNGATSASKFVDLVQDPPEVSPLLLKRRGAKKITSSPGRDRRKTSDLVSEHSQASLLSSNETTSSVEAPDSGKPLRPPGLTFKRPFPSTGLHRLSTIASVETFSTHAENALPSCESEISKTMIEPTPLPLSEMADEAPQRRTSNTLKKSKSRLTKHADLMSVLSLPRAGSKSIISARSIRTNRSRLANASIEDLLKELDMDESKYMRELRTLVDGVIPVLLTCVLSKSDAAVAAGLFRPSASTIGDPNFTKPIVDMGIALERLKSLHKRIPRNDSSALLTWAHGAQWVYAEYLKVWRMGFQDVVVNLAPALEDDALNSAPLGHDPDGLDEGLPRNKDGDVVGVDGERVDVAFLLKRPLVRLKYLAKTFKGINFVKPSSEAEALATKYQNLVIDARNRSNEERARLEDEAAANIDATRARDARTLAPLTGVTIDKTRRVRARDHFNLALQHSSGQCIDCRVELLLRDEADGVGNGGDVLICEVDSSARWLLFPPVQLGRVSARNGDLKGEIVVMVRGFGGDGLEWQELFSLRSNDEQAGFEWVQMLGLNPVPPRIMRVQSFLSRHSRKKSSSEPNLSVPGLPTTPDAAGKSRSPSPREIEIPIGEPACLASRRWIEQPAKEAPVAPCVTSPSRERARLRRKSQTSGPNSPSNVSHNYVDEVNDLRSPSSQASSKRAHWHDQLQRPVLEHKTTDRAPILSPLTLRRTKAKRISRYSDSLSTDAISAKSPDYESEAQKSEGQPCSMDAEDINEQNGVPPTPTIRRSISPEPDSPHMAGSRDSALDLPKDDSRSPLHHIRSSVPSMELPIIRKVRKDSPPIIPMEETGDDLNWDLSANSPPSSSNPATKLSKSRSIPLETAREEKSLPLKLQSLPSSAQLKDIKTPVFDTKAVQNTKRRSSSPLKHEYEPSTASETSSDSETSTVEHNEVASTTDSSEDDGLEDAYAQSPASLLPLPMPRNFPKVSPPGSLYSIPNGTLAPSQSASQAPYKTVPSQPTKASKTIASIFSWSDKGAWESLHPDECSIVITPGLIEAYTMSAAHSDNAAMSSPAPSLDVDAFGDPFMNMKVSKEDVQTERPLVALELTPLVPLRRGTALDISIRSPPRPDSQITSSNNVMFRSRNPEECEALYALINQSRINNPTYILYQNARGPYAPGSSFGPSFDRRASIRTGGSRASSWFGGLGRSSSYRASSVPTPSVAPTQSSISSMTSVISALKWFGKSGGGGMFNIARSTISSRNGSHANSIYTSSDNSSGSGASSPIPLGGDGAGGRPAPIGLTNTKIRLYLRETASKWQDMGSARLTIMLPTNPSGGIAEGNRLSTGRINEKRIIIHGKTKGEVLLDVQLGEHCFEKAARTGIALNVWEDAVGPNGEVGVVGAVGGVGGGRMRVYMIQVRCLLAWLSPFSFSISPLRFFPKTDRLTGWATTDENRGASSIHLFASGQAKILRLTLRSTVPNHAGECGHLHRNHVMNFLRRRNISLATLQSEWAGFFRAGVFFFFFDFNLLYLIRGS